MTGKGKGMGTGPTPGNGLERGASTRRATGRPKPSLLAHRRSAPPSAPAARPSVPPPAPAAAATDHLSRLPAEVFVAVLSHLCIDDALALRLASRRARATVDANLPRCGLARQVVRNTFPRARLLLRTPPRLPSPPASPGVGSFAEAVATSASWGAAGDDPTEELARPLPSPQLGRPPKPRQHGAKARAQAPPPQQPPGDGCDLAWMKSRIPMRLAAVAVDRCTLWEILSGPPAEEDLGDEVRARVANGWRVFKLLSNIGRQVHALSRRELLAEFLLKGGGRGNSGHADGVSAAAAAAAAAETGDDGAWSMKGVGMGTRDAGFLRGLADPRNSWELLVTEARENLTWRRTLALLERLSPADCHDFRLLFHFLFCAFRCAAYPDWESRYESRDFKRHLEPYFFDCYRNMSWAHAAANSGSDKESAMPKLTPEQQRRHLTRGNCWMTWLLLHEGPDLFWTQWNPDRKKPHHVRDTMRAEWAKRSPKQVAVERKYASWIWYAIYWRSLSKSKLWKFKYTPAVNTAPYGRRPHIQRYFVTVGGYLRSLYSDNADRFDALYDHGTGIKSQVAWYLWQKGKIKIDQDFDVSDFFGCEDVRKLLFDKQERSLDSLQGVPYEIYL